MYLIIGGATKSGTTSLYKYLSDSPDFVPAYTKETRFFLDEAYPLPKKNEGFSVGDFNKLFAIEHGVKIDATPDYLFSLGTPERIREVLEDDVLIVFILRDPVKRFLSWYSFARQIGEIGKEVSLKEFIGIQKRSYKESKKQIECVLYQGLYKSNLESYLRVYDKANVLTVDFDFFSRRPGCVVRGICEKVGANESFYDEYIFGSHNKTKELRYPKINKYYMAFARMARNYLRAHPGIRSALKPIKSVADAFLDKLNRIERGEISISSEEMKFLKEFYRDDWVEVKNNYIDLDF